MTASLIISFIARPINDQTDGYWLHIEQAGQDENTATLGEVAKLVDALYGIDPCSEYDGENSAVTIDNADSDNYPVEDGQDLEEDNLSLSGNLTHDEFQDRLAKLRFWQDTVKEYLELNICQANVNGDYKTKIKVALSHPGDHYTLRLANGKIDRTTTYSGNFSKTVTIDKVSDFELDFPVLGNAEFNWVGSVVAGQYGYKTGPEIVLSGRTLSWGEQVTGSLSIKYSTRYDLVDITVFGTDEGEPGECRALCFYHGLLDQIDLTAPNIDNDATELDRQKYCPTMHFEGHSEDVITCYETVTTTYVCQCTNTPAYSVTEDVTVPCPQSTTRCNMGLYGDTHLEDDGKWHCSSYMGSRTVFGNYVPCPERLYNNQTGQWADNGENSILGEADYYKQRCCHDPNGSLPECQTRWEKNSGGSEIPPDVLAKYKARYGDQLQLIAVSPEDGDCGYIKTTIGDIPKNCCIEEWDPMEWDEENSATVINDNSYGFVSVKNGQPPFTWSVRGVGFFLNESGTMRDGVTDESTIKIYTKNSCGPCVITVSDKCRKVVGELRSAKGTWVTRPGDTVVTGKLELQTTPGCPTPNCYTGTCQGGATTPYSWCHTFGSVYNIGYGINARWQVYEHMWHDYSGGDGDYSSCDAADCVNDSGFRHLNQVPGWPYDWCWKYGDWTKFNCDYIKYRDVLEFVC